MLRQSTKEKLKTISPSHQSSPVCARRKLAGFADKSIFVAPTQTQTRNASGTEIGTRYRYIDDTPLVPFNEKGTGSLVVGSGSSSSATGASSTSAGATAKTRSRPSNEYVLYAYGEPIAMTADGNASYFGTDILGSVRSVTDKYGAVQSEYNYDAFGNPYLSNLDNEMSFGYCGKTYDNGTGLYDYGFRDYSPNQARFTTVDPIRDGANWFSYVVNDPVNYIDPLGLTATDQAYEVQPGDCLWEIAAQANNKDGGNRTAQQLAEQNNIANPDLIYPGDIIYIPSTPTPPSQPAPSAPAPEAPAPAAPAPTVPTPSVPSAPPVSTGNLSSPSGGHSSGNFNNSNSYIQRSVEQIILGNYTDEVTLLGTAIQILLSFLNFDVLADIRDLSADFVNWEWSKQHVLCTSLDLVALLPVLGILKNTDEAAALVKNGKKASAAGKGGTTVLGHYPEYVKLAEKLDAKVFHVPKAVWDKMSPAEQWAANAKFLDRAIARGDAFQLATKASEARAGSFFERELQYLTGKGYTVGPCGTSLLPPAAP